MSNLPSWFIDIQKSEVVSNAPSWFIDIFRPTDPEDEVRESLELSATKVQEGDFVSRLSETIRSKEAPRFGYDS